MFLDDAISRLRTDLSDTGATQLLTNSELGRAVERAVADLSRFLPQNKVAEFTLNFTVTSESFTTGAAHGTYVSLAYKPIQLASEVVKNTAGTTTYTRDTDYTIDYTNGKITTISGGAMAVSTGYLVSYTKHNFTIDISSILSGLIKVTKVECPVGKVPREFVQFEIQDDLLVIMSSGNESECNLTDKDHVAVFYECEQIAPTEESDGTYPCFLDDTILLGGSAYALMTLGIQYEHLAATDNASSRTILAALSTTQGLATTALAAFVTNIAAAVTALGAATTALGKADTAAGTVDVSTAQTYFASAASLLANVTVISLDKATTGAEAYLDSGDDKIPTNNTGQDVAENYSAYSRSRVEIARARVEAANSYVQAGIGEVNGASTLASQSSMYNREAEAYVAEGVQRIQLALGYLNQAQIYLQQIDRYISSATSYQNGAQLSLTIAEKYRNAAAERRNEMWTILKDPNQIAPMYSLSSGSQIPSE
jgi:hypothetical protein